MSLELLIEKENIEKKIKTLMPTEEDYKTLIEKAGLIEINNYKFDKFINKGNASSTAIYKNKQENILVKFLIGPRNSDELSSFCNEFYAQSIINKNKIQGFKSIPEIKIDLNKAKNFPIIFFGMEFIEGKSLKDIINKNRHNKCFPFKMGRSFKYYTSYCNNFIRNTCKGICT
jgi:hypothetical protein